jgi:hypothetical protein
MEDGVVEREAAVEETAVTRACETSIGIPGETAAPAIVGKGALGSTFHPLAVEAGHAGAVVLTVAAYCAELTPVGFRVFHCSCRFEKSGEMGVGTPWRVNL